MVDTLTYPQTESKFPDVSNMKVDNWGWIEVDKILQEIQSSDFNDWEEGLEEKRQADHYSQLKYDIQNKGLFHPICIEQLYGNPIVVNGHHRLAVLIDLGYTHAPYIDQWDDCWFNEQCECGGYYR